MADQHPSGAGIDLDKIKQALENVLTLVIVTDVGGKQMKTTVRLDQGDITNEVDPAFVTGEYKDLREFHEAQVQKGQQIIRDNIAALQKLFVFVRDNLHT